jgi:hypothetical protein
MMRMLRICTFNSGQDLTFTLKPLTNCIVCTVLTILDL